MSYAGDLTPRQAWDLLEQNPGAVLVDVRTEAEWNYVGIPDPTATGRELHLIEWVTSTGHPNPDFVDQLKLAVEQRPDDAPVLFICRSGQRSLGAASAATDAGIAPSYNVVHGFEGGLDATGHRGGTGWRAEGLPWRQS
jgi:rhodanese-related sulfurtransferase